MGIPQKAAVSGVIAAAVLLSIMSVKFHPNFKPSLPPYKRNRPIENATHPNSTKIVVDVPIEKATHPHNTRAVVLNRERVYCQGDVLTARIVAKDRKERPKTYGGDFFRAKLVSYRSKKASTAGHVIDHGNGTYTVQFLLYWAGDVRVSIKLVHPSEAVMVLRRVRDVPNKRVFFCYFEDPAKRTKEKRQCFSSENPSQPLRHPCDLSKCDANATWFCERPTVLPCSTISKCKWDQSMSARRVISLTSKDERKVFKSPYIEKELEQDNPGPISVRKSGLSTLQRLSECSGNTSDVMSHGFWSGNIWKPSPCKIRIIDMSWKDIQRCLAAKTLYLQGDSTLRQWYLRLAERMSLESHGNTDHGPATAEDKSLRIAVHYRFHGFPIQGHRWVNFSQIRYVADELDTIQGGPNTVIVLSVWAHFTQEPLEMLRERLQAIRYAIRHLLHRSPGTRVFVRTGTTREHTKLVYYLIASDWLAYQNTQEIRHVFRNDKDVVVLDTWDMSVCQWGKHQIHPDKHMVDSELRMLFSHFCLK